MSQYANVVRRREAYVTDSPKFAAAFVEGFRRKLVATRDAYLARKTAFDELFIDRPYDTNGSGAYRWAKALQRLANCEPEHVAGILKAAIGC